MRRKKIMWKEDESIKSLIEQTHILLSFRSSENHNHLSDSFTSIIEDPSFSKLPPKNRGRKKVLVKNLSISFDVEKLSDRKAHKYYKMTWQWSFKIQC